MNPASSAFRNLHGLQATLTSRQTNNQVNHQDLNKISISPLTKDREIAITTDETDLKIVVENVNEQTINYKTTMSVKQLLTDDVDIKECSIESAMNNLEEMEGIVKDKNCLIAALALMIDLYQSNTLIENKLIVAEEEVLIKLLYLLTDADEVELVKKDIDIGCLCSSSKIDYFDKIN